MTKSSLAKLILRNHTGRHSMRRDYLDHLTERTVDNMERYHGRGGEATAVASISTRRMLERIYSLLQPYAFELNSIVGGNGFTITCSPPSQTTESTREEWPYQAPRMVQIYRCRFATSMYSASIRALDDRVEFFVIPGGQSIRLSEGEDEYGRLMAFELDRAQVWVVERKPLTDDRFERYCLLFFDYFVNKSQKEIAETGVYPLNQVQAALS